MSLYGRIFAWGYDRFQARMEEDFFGEIRREMLADVRGRVVEIGAGTGANLAHYPPTVEEVVCTEPEEPMARRLREKASASGLPVRVVEAPAERLPFDDDSFDVAVAALVLNFVPDLPAALAELRRVVRPGGTVGAYFWDVAGDMQIIRFFWDAAIALDPDARVLDEGAAHPLCRPEALRAAFGAAFADVEVDGITVPTVFRDFDDFWTPFLGGVGPAPAYVVALDEPHRAALRESLRERLPYAADGSIPLVARAWAVRART